MWKGLSTNSAIPSHSRPSLKASGATFKANPIKHWRKQLLPTSNSGVPGRRAGIGMPMDTPGGAVYLGNVNANTDCLVNATSETTGLKEDIPKFNNTNFSANLDRQGCLTGACNPEKNRIKSATTLLSKTYYADHLSYVRARNNLYDQKLTALPLSGVTYLDNAGNKLPVNANNATRRTQDCGPVCPLGNLPSSITTLPGDGGKTIYKPNNAQYAKQGAVDSSDRITRLKLNTVNKNASSYTAVFGTSSSRYMGMASTPYFAKSKYQACVPMTLSGNKRLCVV